MADTALRVTLQRYYRASQETVFRAFTEPQFLERWLSPRKGVTMKVRELDLKVGGRFQFAFSDEVDKADFVAGYYREVSPFERLVMTWGWEEPDPHAGIETLLTVDFETRGDQTHVMLTHEQFPDAPLRNRHDDGWTGALDNLLAILT